MTVAIKPIVKVDKVRYDYAGKVGLTKVDGVVKLWGCGVEWFNADVKSYLLNYGLFVHLTRTIAGKEKWLDKDKLDLINQDFQALASGVKKERGKSDSIGNVLKVAKTSDQLDENEKETLAKLLAKMKK